MLDARTQEVDRRVRVQREMAEHDVGATAVGAVVLGEQSRIGLHVVVQQQQQLASRGLGARGSAPRRPRGSAAPAP